MDLSGFKKFGEAKPDTDYEVLEFDGQIDDEGQFIDLKDGTYPFTVKSVSKEVKTTRTGQEIPVVNVILSVNGGEQGITPLKHSFWLTKKNMWNISDFFISIGAMKSGEKGFRMHWDDLFGKEGFAELNHREYDKKDGTKGTILNVKRFKRQEA